MISFSQNDEIKKMVRNGFTRSEAMRRLGINPEEKELHKTELPAEIKQQHRVATDEKLQAIAKLDKNTKDGREPVCVLAIGEKGVGKTYTSFKFFTENYTISTANKKGRKLLIFDTNGEFEEVDPIRFQDIEAFKQQRVIEMRRLLAKDPETMKDLGMDGKAELLARLLDEVTPRNMGLFLEDYNSYVIGAQSKKMIDLLTTNRHKALDLFIHLQTFRSVPPRIWGNVNILRLHSTGDSPDQVKDKVRNFKITKIAWLLVEKKCRKDPRFYVYVNYDEKKITGKFTHEEILDATEEYLIGDERKEISRVKMRQKIKSIDEAVRYIALDLVDLFTISKKQ